MSVRTDAFLPPEASRLDASNGTTERVAFLGREGRRLFSCTYLPSSSPRGIVLICPPMHAEFTRNYRREVLLARGLAGQGFVVGRFHYRGTGNSDGQGADVTFRSMQEDAIASLEHLRREAQVDTEILVGTRWGALVAASTATHTPRAALVMWEPLFEAKRFFKDAFRTRAVAELKSGVERPTTGEELALRLRSGEAVDVVGHTIESAFYGSSVERSLVDELGSSPRSLLLVQIGPSMTVRPELARHVDRWRSVGFCADVATVEGDETWWLVDARWHDEGSRPMTRDLIGATAEWIVDLTEQRRGKERSG